MPIKAVDTGPEASENWKDTHRQGSTQSNTQILKLKQGFFLHTFAKKIETSFV